MLQIDVPSLLNLINKESKIALEQAASLCVEQGVAEITIAHWLYVLLENPVGDFRTLLKLAKIDHEEVKQTLAKGFAHQARGTGSLPNFSPLLVELIQEAWTLGSVELGHQSLRSGVVVLCVLLNVPRYMPFETISLFEKINREALRKDFNNLFTQTSEHPITQFNNKGEKITDKAATALQKFAHDFTEQAKQGHIDPVLCRDSEIDQMIDILTRRRKNNPIIVGDAGVGKSALVEGLALRIIENRVPKMLQGVSLWGLDMGALQAGAAVKGEFEKRLKAVIDEVKNAASPVILFIDEAHTLIGAGNNAGGSDAANLLKPALARGELRTIAATTWSEYKKYFEKDPALSRRFQLVKLHEPTIEQAVHILRGLRATYEQAHHVYISDEAIQAAVEMSARFISGRQLPDKAIDVLDTASARVATALVEPPRRLVALENETTQIQRELDHLNRDIRMGRSVDSSRSPELLQLLEKNWENKKCLEQIWEKQKSLVDEILVLREKLDTRQASVQSEEALSPDAADSNFAAQLGQKVNELSTLQKEEALIHADVGKEQIAQVIASWTGIPATTISANRMERLRLLPEIIGQRIKGQDSGIEHIHRHLLTAMADLRRPGTPIGAFILVGPSGVGKTEAVRVIAQEFFGGLQFLTSINMSEYQEKHTVSRLLGSPPGYIGYGEGGILTEAIRQKPYSVVLLDEVEKAHPEVLNVFYQAFDKGEITDGEGQVIDCKNIVFFMTSNIGFDSAEDALEEPDQIDVRKKLMMFFKPALLARMQIVPFKHLDEDVLAQIVDIRLTAIQKQVLHRYKAHLEMNDSVKEELKSRCMRHENGARMLDASIDGELLPPLSISILEQLAAGNAFTHAILTWSGERFVADIVR